MRRYRSELLPGLLLVAIALARPWLEATMARHMAVEIPLLFAVGWLAAHLARPDPDSVRSLWNAAALPAFFAALLVNGFWMLPVALDLAVLHPGMGIVKIISIVASGAATGAFWRKSGLVMQAFTVLNWVWMTLTAGLLYQDYPSQLCSVYLDEQQSVAGSALVVLAVTVLVAWLFHAYQLLADQGTE